MAFWRGFAAAILSVELCALAYVLGIGAPHFVRLYADLGPHARLPLVFDIVTSAAFRVAAFVGLLSLAVIADRVPRDPGRRAVGLGIVAALGAAILGLSLWSLYAPIFQLAGRIEAH